VQSAEASFQKFERKKSEYKISLSILSPFFLMHVCISNALISKYEFDIRQYKRAGANAIKCVIKSFSGLEITTFSSISIPYLNFYGLQAVFLHRLADAPNLLCSPSFAKRNLGGTRLLANLDASG